MGTALPSGADFCGDDGDGESEALVSSPASSFGLGGWARQLQQRDKVFGWDAAHPITVLERYAASCRGGYLLPLITGPLLCRPYGRCIDRIQSLPFSLLVVGRF